MNTTFLITAFCDLSEFEGQSAIVVRLFSASTVSVSFCKLGMFNAWRFSRHNQALIFSSNYPKANYFSNFLFNSFVAVCIYSRIATFNTYLFLLQMNRSSISTADNMQWTGNPFEHFVSIAAKDRLKYAFMSIVLAPIRIALAGIMFGMAYMAAIITLFNLDTNFENPLNGWRQTSKDIVAQLIIMSHFMMGFHRVKVKGRRALPTEAPILVIAPHSSFFDTLPFCCIGAPSVVGKKSLMKIPFFGKLLSLTKPILVDRNEKGSRSSAAHELKQRANLVFNGAKNNGMQWPQIAIFPEGTCTNRSQLISFKPGAFMAQLPVQPVCLRWPNKYDFVSWTWEGTAPLKLFWLSVCQLQTNLEIEFLPVYVPNEAEKGDANLYARNVRAVMARCLQIPTDDYYVEDARYLTLHGKGKLEEFFDLLNRLNMSLSVGEDLHSLQAVWNYLRHSEFSAKHFAVTYNEFQSYLHFPKDQISLRRVFNIMDWQCRRRIDLREFWLACFSKKYTSPIYLDYCQKMFSTTVECLSEVDFVKIVRLPYELSVAEARQLYERRKRFFSSQERIPSSDVDFQKPMIVERKKFSSFNFPPIFLRRRCIEVY
ncbi:Lysophosphatidylcholine acyltransferase 1 [Trichinella pseudospiralis]|uniref:Lysophosphatidylcholine acyltransferase 1 n=2 Tax=Trichinella pseudospiralis TaxID=6337 RepID=A0A0V1ITR0_TRIPS|nr:Lysophosphatidylcholine acyltransferase 1 [Trichinella pseudospiralis]